ncbi:ATP-binding cassette domain-containing protein [Robertmurraya massiliosenegalensis]|uniref:ATP-binding cassette domain-containing protein n=1 Tax=Robertmurraya TaxID=2837507 RepID=UPI0039A6408A
MKNEILRLDRVTSKKDDSTFLDNFNLHIFKSEIMGLLCLNTTGKESLVEIIRQNIHIHYGRVFFKEVLVNNYQHSSLTMNKAVVIEPKSSLIEDLTVIENVFVFNRGHGNFIINKRKWNKQLQIYAEELGIALNGFELVANLSYYEKYVVELLRAVIISADLIVVRDISNLISAVELSNFHKYIRYYAEKGISILYICDHHEEAFKICDRLSLMRDGRILKVFDRNEFQNEKMIPFYMSEYANIEKVSMDYQSNPSILSFQNITTKNLDQLTFTLKKGECTLMLDLDNTLLADFQALMTGELIKDSGEIFLENMLFTEKKAQNAISNGVAFIRENPIQTLLFHEMSYIQNLCFMVDKKQNPLPLKKNVIRNIVQEYEPIVGMEIHEKTISNLSLRSLYNLIYYRIHLCNPKIVICVQPFAGADMYLRLHLIELINQLRKKGMTVVILAVSIADSLVVADKMIVIEKGRFSKEYERSEFSQLRSEAISL